MGAENANGHCGKQPGGCTEFQLLEQRMDGVEQFIKEWKDEQKWSRRWQKATAVGVLVSVGMLVIKLFFMG